MRTVGVAAALASCSTFILPRPLLPKLWDMESTWSWAEKAVCVPYDLVTISLKWTERCLPQAALAKRSGLACEQAWHPENPTFLSPAIFRLLLPTWDLHLWGTTGRRPGLEDWVAALVIYGSIRITYHLTPENNNFLLLRILRVWEGGKGKVSWLFSHGVSMQLHSYVSWSWSCSHVKAQPSWM